MSVIIKKNKVKIRSESGQFTDVADAIAEKKVEEFVKEIEEKGQSTKDSIPADYTTLNNEVNSLKDRVNNVAKPTDDQVSSALNDYLKENPVSALDASTAQNNQVPTADGTGKWSWKEQQGSSVVIDNTLAVSGSAADAKATGDAIKADRERITANENARHEHSNKSILDEITGVVTKDKITTPDNNTDLINYEAYKAGNDTLSQEIKNSFPDTLPNPHKIVFTGAVSAEYDGNESVELNIPEAYEDLNFSGDTDFGKKVCDLLSSKPFGFVNCSDGNMGTKNFLVVKTGFDRGYGTCLIGDINTGFKPYNYNASYGSSSYGTLTPLEVIKNPNPKALTFTGKVEGSYDGSEALEINIPDTITFYMILLSKSDDGNYSSSRTFDQIKSAIEENNLMPANLLVSFVDNVTPIQYFGQFENNAYDSQNNKQYYNFKIWKSDTEIMKVAIGSDDTVTVEEKSIIPDALPNPQKITFDGAVTAEYDGSGAVTVTIPSADTSTIRIEKSATDSTAEIEPNKLYVFPEMASLTYTLATPENTSIANEYHFVFQSGTTATELVNPSNVKVPDGFTVDSSKIYEISILEGCMTYQSWGIS